MNEENITNNIRKTSETNNITNNVRATNETTSLDTSIIKCGNFNLEDFVKPIQTINSDQKAELNKLLESANTDKKNIEHGMLDKITERILKSEYMQIDPAFLNVSRTHNFDDGTSWVVSRFAVFPYSGKNIFEINFKTMLRHIRNNYFIYDGMVKRTFPKIISENLIMASEFYTNKESMINWSRADSTIGDSFNTTINRSIKKKYGRIDKGPGKDLEIRTDILITPETKKKMSTNRFVEEYKFVILDYNTPEVKEYPLFVGVHNDKLYIIDNPAMDEYKRLGL